MLIGAYRENEVDSTHPLIRKLEGIRTAGAAVQDIVLAPLTREDLEHLLGDSLRCESQRASSLARLLHEKTAGNPFFAIQFLSSLAEEGLFKFDHRKARWSWNIKRIHAKGYTDNVVDLMVGKLNRLPVETQKVLQQFAYVGNVAHVERSNIPGGLQCTFRSNIEDDESLPVVLRQDLLRIAQEAISNALRHAKSTAIKVTLKLNPPNLILGEKDNGCGITSKAEIKEGFGFVNMRARVERLNGSLDIRTVPGRGSSIIVRVPFKQEPG
jgi:glucose-6-phosphate-specific signal transduction histidine kinase